MTPTLRRAVCGPKLWTFLFLLWFAVLWILSSRSGDMKDLPEIPYFDKAAHFGYFFGGGGLLSTALFTFRRGNIRWPVLFAIVFVVMAGVGILDEYHQTFTPGRSGNDPSDWLADVTGGLCGAFVFKLLSHRFRLPSDGSSRD